VDLKGVYYSRLLRIVAGVCQPDRKFHGAAGGLRTLDPVAWSAGAYPRQRPIFAMKVHQGVTHIP
jgi:hypothetical protein